jgi:hypothetical protein
MGLGSIVSGLAEPISALVNSVGGVISKFVTTDKDKLEAQRELVELERGFQLKVMELDAQWAAQQADVIKAETNSQSWLARNWRPILMLVFTYIIFHNYVLAPLFGLGKADIPPDMWQLLKLGISGYIMGRSAEKVAPKVVEMFGSNRSSRSRDDGD